MTVPLGRKKSRPDVRGFERAEALPTSESLANSQCHYERSQSQAIAFASERTTDRLKSAAQMLSLHSDAEERGGHGRRHQAQGL